MSFMRYCFAQNSKQLVSFLNNCSNNNINLSQRMSKLNYFFLLYKPKYFIQRRICKEISYETINVYKNIFYKDPLLLNENIYSFRIISVMYLIPSDMNAYTFESYCRNITLDPFDDDILYEEMDNSLSRFLMNTEIDMQLMKKLNRLC